MLLSQGDSGLTAKPGKKEKNVPAAWSCGGFVWAAVGVPVTFCGMYAQAFLTTTRTPEVDQPSGR